MFMRRGSKLIREPATDTVSPMFSADDVQRSGDQSDRERFPRRERRRKAPGQTADIDGFVLFGNGTSRACPCFRAGGSGFAERKGEKDDGNEEKRTDKTGKA